MKMITIVSDFIKNRFSLEKHREEVDEVISSIKQNIYFRGPNLWVLIFAIFIASIGLNMNSTAVIIGAMLISPLMGPIMGVGLGAALYDFKLIRISGYNFLIAVIISLITSTIYFLITPLNEAHSELFARTTPTVYDVFIAFFGGMAGIVATSSRIKGNVIPGVAIATALMPPLCTAGYGLATGNLIFFLGAIYLFFINSVFICFATFILVRFLRFPVRHYADQKTEKRMRIWIWLIVFCTSVPSVIIAYYMISRNIYESNANRFITKELTFDGNIIIQKSIDSKRKTIDVVYAGKGIEPILIENIKNKLPVYHLTNSDLRINQGMKEFTPTDITKMKSQIVEELYYKNQETLLSKEGKIELLEKELSKFNTGFLSGKIFGEIRALYPDVSDISVSRALLCAAGAEVPDTVCLFYCKFEKKISKAEKQRLEKWLQARIREEKVKIIIEN